MQQYVAVVTNVRDCLVDSIDRAQKRGLSAAGGTDERSDRPIVHGERHILESLLSSVPERKILRFNRRCRTVCCAGDACVRGSDRGHPNLPVT